MKAAMTDISSPNKMLIEQWPIDKPIPYAKNARKLSPHAVDKVAASLQEFGWQQPLVVDAEGILIVGHTRLLAAKKLGYKMVPVLVAHWLTPAQVKAYRLMDNRSHQETDWDWDLLTPEFAELQALNFDMNLTGFDLEEYTPEVVGLTDEDEVPEVPIAPVTQPGDLWLLGNHRLLCGDSTFVDSVEKVCAGVMPNLMVTDPPYGVEYDPDWRNRADRANGKPYGARAIGTVQNDGRSDWTEAWALYQGDVAYVWHAGKFAATVQKSLEDTGFEIRSQIIWAKSRFAISRGDYHWQHEPCWYAVRKTGKGWWSGDRSQTTLWQVTHNKSETGHGTQKPVEIMRKPIENNSSPGQAVYEPFCGSGTTLIAAEQTGRACIALEIDPAYCDVIVTRWQNFTGKEATLEGWGATFAEAKRGRLQGTEDAIKEEVFGVRE